MSRAEVGVRPLLIDIIKRTISYIKNIKTRTDSLVFEAYTFELNNSIIPNFTTFLNEFEFNENVYENSKYIIKRTCHDYYDRIWCSALNNSPKAISYKMFKNNVKYENYLDTIKFNVRIAISRFRLSNHSLMIEKGRHIRPKLERTQRKCYFCKNEIENEEHFLITCPLYSPLREVLENKCRTHCEGYNYLTQGQKFIFIMSNENNEIINELGNFILHSLEIRDVIIKYFFI